MGCGNSKNKVLDTYIKRESSAVINGSRLVDTNGNDLKDDPGGGPRAGSSCQAGPPKSAWGNTLLSDSGSEIDPPTIPSRSTTSKQINAGRTLRVGAVCNSDEEEEQLKDKTSAESESESGHDSPEERSLHSKGSSSLSSASRHDVTTRHGPGIRADDPLESSHTIVTPLVPPRAEKSNQKNIPPAEITAKSHATMNGESGSEHSISSAGNNSKKNQKSGGPEKRALQRARSKSRFRIPTILRFLDTRENAESESEEASSSDEMLPVPRVITHLARSHGNVYNRDHFWWADKKSVATDYLSLAELDAHAVKKRPRMEPKALVTELTKDCRSKAEELRVIFRWVAANIAYKKMDLSEPVAQTPVFVYNRRFGNCLGFCNLLQYLLCFREIGCEVIEGLAKGASYIPGEDLDILLDPEAPCRHSWNRVEIEDCWFLCDVTWAREHDINAEGAREVKPSRFKEVWYLTDPEIFIKSHLPLVYDEYVEQFVPDPEQQHLYQPCPSVQEWHSYAWITASAMEWGVKPISHKESIIWTEGNYIEISFECSNTMTYTYSLTSMADGKSFFGYTILYCTDSAVVEGHVRLPMQGSYLFRIQASPKLDPDIIAPEKEDSDVIFIYRIEASGPFEYAPFYNGRNPSWGITPEFLDTGCSVVDYKGAVYHTETGTLTVSLRLPTSDIFPHMINYTSVVNLDEDLGNMIYSERDGRQLNFHLICPKCGDYLLSFWLKNSPDTAHLDVSLNLFIQSSVEASEEFFYPAHHSLWGPQEPTSSLGIVPISPMSSTVTAKGGACVITIELTQHINVSHRLLNTDGTDCKNWKRCVYAEQDGDRLNYFLHLPEKGRFMFKIAGGGHDETSHHVALVYMIENLRKPFKGHLYPEHENFPWGIRNEFIQLGLECTQYVSTLRVVNQEARVSIKLPDMKVLFRTIFSHADTPQDSLDNYCVITRCKNLTDVTIIVRLPYPGYYALRLFEATQGTPLANFLLQSNAAYKGQVYTFEPYTGIYGATEEFLERGLEIISDMTSEIAADAKGKCQIILKVPKTVDLLLIVKHKGKEVKGHLLPLRHEDRVTFTFHGKCAGYHQLKGYAKGSKRKPDLLFVFLIHVVTDNPDWKPFPDGNTVWGLNKEAGLIGVQVKSKSRESQSLIKCNKGIASVTFQHGEDYQLMGWLKSPEPSVEDYKTRVFVEKLNQTSFMKVSLPDDGYYVLKVGAAKSGAAKYRTVGTFVLESSSHEGRDVGFPEYNNFFEGCKLESPHVNPIPAGSEQLFRIRIPEAERVRLWEDEGRWKIDLKLQDGDLFSNLVNVCDPKNLWITARFPKDSLRGEEGRYRNVLMYKVV